MKKFIVPMLVCVLALNACSALQGQTTPPTQAVDLVGTTNAIVSTSYAQTLTAQPSPTAVPPTNTFTATATSVVAQESPTQPAVSPTSVPNLTTTPATATSGPGDTPSAPTPTRVPGGSGSATPYPTLQVLTYGTLPPQNRPYTGAKIINASRSEAYISLQIVTDQGYTIIEHPVRQVINILIPTGDYTYVVWVGGRQFVGYFSVHQGSGLTITIFRDRVEVNKELTP